MFNLKAPTPSEWINAVLNDVDTFMVDHAACERKASATALSFTVRYPNRTELVKAMLHIALEELEHFSQVTHLIHQRGGQLGHDRKDHYVRDLLKLVRGPSEERLIDRLLIFGVIEGRGCERFQIFAENVEDPELKTFYMDLVRAEARHHASFIHQVRKLTDEKTLKTRLEELLDAESDIMLNLPITAFLH